jgi:hypothetical protein
MKDSNYLKRTQKDYTMSFKLQVVQEVEMGLFSVNQTKNKHSIKLTPHRFSKELCSLFFASKPLRQDTLKYYYIKKPPECSGGFLLVCY